MAVKLVPPLIAAASAVLLTGGSNLDRVRGLGAPIVTIGGADTFDGSYLAGITAVVLAVAS